MKKRIGLNLFPALTLSALMLAFTGLASGQATRTWVSGVGDDANPCSRTAPCKTFPGAISKTTAKGEINCLDPGGFGAVTITKSITIDCTGNYGSILASGTNAITVNAATTDAVTIRGISINGFGTGLSGIRILAAGSVHVEDVTIFGFQAGSGTGIDVASAANTILTVVNTTITDCLNGIAATTTAGNVFGDINNVRIWGNTNDGIVAGMLSVLTIRNSNISLNTFGVQQTAGGSQVNLIGNQINNHAIAVQSFAGSNMRIVGNTFAQNGIVVDQNGGIVNSGGNNNSLGNGINGAVGSSTGTI